MLTWKTGCVSVRCVSLGTMWSSSVSHAPYQREEAAQLLLSASTQHVFSLRLALPICERHCFYKSSDRANQLNLKCVCLSLFGSWLYDLWGEILALGGVGPAPARAQEMLGGFSFLSDFNDSNERMERKFGRMGQRVLVVQSKKQGNWRTMYELLLKQWS